MKIKQNPRETAQGHSAAYTLAGTQGKKLLKLFVLVGGSGGIFEFWYWEQRGGSCSRKEAGPHHTEGKKGLIGKLRGKGSCWSDLRAAIRAPESCPAARLVSPKGLGRQHLLQGRGLMVWDWFDGRIPCQEAGEFYSHEALSQLQEYFSSPVYSMLFPGMSSPMAHQFTLSTERTFCLQCTLALPASIHNFISFSAYRTYW